MNPQHFYLHRISPYILRFGGQFGLRWYGLSYVAGFIVGLFLLRYLSQKGLLKLLLNDVDALLTYLIIGVLIGGRLGYILFYQPSLLLQLTASPPFWGVLAINQGGMSSHGGFLGVWLVIILFAKRHGVSWLHVGDAVVMSAPVGLFFGRLANFVNGELYGRPSVVPWAVCFPTEIMNWSTQRLNQLTGALAEKGFIYDSTERLLDAIRNNDTVANIVQPFLTPRHPSQIYEALLEGVCLFAILWWFGMKRSRRDGRITALFFLCYGVMRIFAEQFREPDAGIGYQILGLTRGQLLSFGMLFIGAVFWYISMMNPIVKYNHAQPSHQKPAQGKGSSHPHS